jgi:hypothetical protein
MYIRMGGQWLPVLDAWIRGNPSAGTGAVTATLLEPFNNLTTNNWSANASAVIDPAGRTGSAVRLSAGNINWTIPAGSESDTLTIGFAYKWGAAVSAGGDLLRLASDAGATLHVRLCNLPDGTLQVFRYLSGTLGQSNPGVLGPAGTWHYIELQVKLNDTTWTPRTPGPRPPSTPCS